jgi:hypothetical protein
LTAKKTISWPRFWKSTLRKVELKSYQKSHKMAESAKIKHILAESACSGIGFQAASNAG